jgi:hypothetical protein
MPSHVRVLVAVFSACACAALAGAAQAAETLSFQASFTPDRLGAPANLSASATFASSEGAALSPVTQVTTYGPAGMSVDVRGAGTCTASPATLESLGPTACPADSRIGFGRAVGLQELAHERIPGPFTLEFFLAPRQDGHLVALIYVDAVSPASEQLVLVAREVQAPRPYGFGITFEVPIVPTIPGAPLGWVQHAFVTLGSANVAYYKTVRGRRTLFHVKGIVVPRTCPRGGFPVELQVRNADGSAAAAKASIPCPSGRDERRSSQDEPRSSRGERRSSQDERRSSRGERR